MLGAFDCLGFALTNHALRLAFITSTPEFTEPHKLRQKPPSLRALPSSMVLGVARRQKRKLSQVARSGCLSQGLHPLGIHLTAASVPFRSIKHQPRFDRPAPNQNPSSGAVIATDRSTARALLLKSYPLKAEERRGRHRSHEVSTSWPIERPDRCTFVNYAWENLFSCCTRGQSRLLGNVGKTWSIEQRHIRRLLRHASSAALAHFVSAPFSIVLRAAFATFTKPV